MTFAPAKGHRLNAITPFQRPGPRLLFPLPGKAESGESGEAERGGRFIRSPYLLKARVAAPANKTAADIKSRIRAARPVTSLK